MSNYDDATDELMANADTVMEWLHAKDKIGEPLWGGLESDRTAALVRILTAGSARALLRAQEALIELFAADHADEINELAARMDAIPAERAQDLRDELAGYRT
jgi:hypothetical protein